MKRTFLLAALFTVRCVLAQQYSVDWYKIAGGGAASVGTNAGTVYSISGTIGQYDASTAMTGSDFSLTGGFWSIYAVQWVRSPLLSIKSTNGMVMVYWSSPSTGFNLQVNTNLSNSNWIAPPQSVTDNGTIKFILLSPPSGNAYYRLKSP